MVDIYGCHFEYKNKSSREYGLIFANVETKRFLQLSGSIKGETIFHKGTKRRYLLGDNYEDSPVEFEVEIVTDNGSTIDRDERREIERWLFNRPSYGRLYIDSEDDYFGDTSEIIDGEEKRLYLNCRFVNPTRIEYRDGVTGYKATLEADCGFWWQDNISITKTLNHTQLSSQSTITIEVDTDIEDYVYPDIRFTTGDVAGDVTITNQQDILFPAVFKSIGRNTTVDADGSINFVNHVELFMADQHFLRLVNGENNIVVRGCVKDIIITFQNRRLL